MSTFSKKEIFSSQLLVIVVLSALIAVSLQINAQGTSKTEYPGVCNEKKTENVSLLWFCSRKMPLLFNNLDHNTLNENEKPTA